MAQNKLSRNKRTDAAKRAVALQPERTKANKLRKLLKHMTRQPNDRQAAKALEGITS